MVEQAEPERLISVKKMEDDINREKEKQQREAAKPVKPVTVDDGDR